MGFWRRGRRLALQQFRLKVLHLAVLVVLVFVVLISGTLAQIPDDRLIAPGERIGRFRLRMSASEAASALGSPGERRAFTPMLSGLLNFTPLRTSYGLWWRDKAVFMLFTPTSDRATGIVLFEHPDNRGFRTFEGVGIGSPFAELNRFGGAEGSEGGETEGKLIYWTIGLYVHWRDGRITAIGVLDNKAR